MMVVQAPSTSATASKATAGSALRITLVLPSASSATFSRVQSSSSRHAHVSICASCSMRSRTQLFTAHAHAAAASGSCEQQHSIYASNNLPCPPENNTQPGNLPEPTSTSSTAPTASTNSPLPQLTDTQLLNYERRGWLVTRNVLPEEDVQALASAAAPLIAAGRLDALRHRVRVLCPGVDPKSVRSEEQAVKLLRKQGSDQLGFLQFFNLHRSHAPFMSVSCGARLASAAAQVLGVKKVRLYQDCLFLKEPGYAETNWHSDLRMAPLDTNAFVTAWLPLRPIDGARGKDSGMQFAAGSHRDFALPFWHDMQGRDLTDRGYEVQGTGGMALGDVSWHHGWTLHCAAPQPPGTPPRLALAVCFYADGARVLARGGSDPSVRQGLLHDEDSESYREWLKDIADGGLARHALLPLVWPQQQQQQQQQHADVTAVDQVLHKLAAKGASSAPSKARKSAARTQASLATRTATKAPTGVSSRKKQ